MHYSSPNRRRVVQSLLGISFITWSQCITAQHTSCSARADQEKKIRRRSDKNILLSSELYLDTSRKDKVICVTAQHTSCGSRADQILTPSTIRHRVKYNFTIWILKPNASGYFSKKQGHMRHGPTFELWHTS